MWIDYFLFLHFWVFWLCFTGRSTASTSYVAIERLQPQKSFFQQKDFFRSSHTALALFKKCSKTAVLNFSVWGGINYHLSKFKRLKIDSKNFVSFLMFHIFSLFRFLQVNMVHSWRLERVPMPRTCRRVR